MFGFRTHLARRLMLYIATGLISTLLLTVIAQFWALQSMLEQTRERSLNDTIDSMIPLVSQSVWKFHEQDAKSTVDAILRSQFVSGVRVADNIGDFTYQVGNIIQTSLPVDNTNEIIKESVDDTLIFTVPLIIESISTDTPPINIGAVQLFSENALMKKQSYEVRQLTVVSLFISSCFLLMLFYLLIRKTIAKPLERITGMVQQLTQDITSYPEDLSLNSRKDEIGRLSTVFHQQRSELVERDKALEDHRQKLEKTVQERTSELQEANKTLVTSLSQLERAQQELIQNEKLASLGTLVSGIAHEVNTPLGVSITAASHLIEELKQTKQALAENKLTRSGFENFIAASEETENLLLNNLNRAAKLVQSFKKVAVDQSSDEQRLIDLREYVDEITLSLRPKLKQTRINVSNLVPKGVLVTLAPGALAQILTNLITNSIIHGFNNGQNPGEIHIKATQTSADLILEYQDNGAGMDQQTLTHMYDPFFTTKRSEGGSGLGMNIVYNLVTSKLNGSIESTSSPNHGLTVIMTINMKEVLQETLHDG